MVKLTKKRTTKKKNIMYKNLLLVMILSFITATAAYGQVRMQHFSSNEELTSTTQFNTAEISYKVFGDNRDDVDSLIIIMGDGLGDFSYQITFIQSITISEDNTLVSFKVIQEDGNWFNIIFRYGIYPQVMHEFRDGYLIYSGNVKY